MPAVPNWERVLFGGEKKKFDLEVQKDVRCMMVVLLNKKIQVSLDFSLKNSAVWKRLRREGKPHTSFFP